MLSLSLLPIKRATPRFFVKRSEIDKVQIRCSKPNQQRENPVKSIVGRGLIARLLSGRSQVRFLPSAKMKPLGNGLNAGF